MGVVLFRRLKGKKKNRYGEKIEAIVEVCSAPVPKATSDAPDLPPEVDAFFARALERDVDKRFQSALEMAQALGDLVQVVADHKVASALEVFEGPSPTTTGDNLPQAPQGSTADHSLSPSQASRVAQATPLAQAS